MSVARKHREEERECVRVKEREEREANAHKEGKNQRMSEQGSKMPEKEAEDTGTQMGVR